MSIIVCFCFHIITTSAAITADLTSSARPHCAACRVPRARVRTAAVARSVLSDDEASALERSVGAFWRLFCYAVVRSFDAVRLTAHMSALSRLARLSRLTRLYDACSGALGSLRRAVCAGARRRRALQGVRRARRCARWLSATAW